MTETYKECTSCGAAKPITEFYSKNGEKSGRDGHTARCKVCIGRDVAKYRQANREKMRQAEAARRVRDKPKILTIHSLSRKRRLVHERERLRKWRKRRPDADRAHQILREAMENGLMVRPEKCEQCGVVGTIDGHHDDYAEPLVVRWLCRPCHSQEHRSKIS